MKFQLVKNSVGNYIPATDQDRERQSSVGHGEVIEAKALDQRNVMFHRKFFALIELAWQNLPEKYDKNFPTKDDLRKELIKRAGFYRQYIDFKGNMQFEAESISFANMGQKRFEEVYNGVIDVILRWLIPIDREGLEREVVNFM